MGLNMRLLHLDDDIVSKSTSISTVQARPSARRSLRKALPSTIMVRRCGAIATDTAFPHRRKFTYGYWPVMSGVVDVVVVHIDVHHRYY
jgi:hypothetical protein